MAHHPIVHIEISAQDPAASDKFYAQLFDWKMEVDKQFDYHQFKAEGGPAGAFVKVDGQQYKAGDIVPYIATDDIDATLKKVAALGGKTLTPRTEIAGTGWFAFFADPSGNRIGLFTEKGRMD